ncbi:hypothetical protein LguiB_020894 [Lonicera macranthoides]
MRRQLSSGGENRAEHLECSGKNRGEPSSGGENHPSHIEWRRKPPKPRPVEKKIEESC